MGVKVSLTGRISIEGGGVIVDEQQFPGRQGRLVFAYLVAARGRPVPRAELADALWNGGPPATWDKALSVLVSKLRALLNEAGVDAAESLTSAFGCYRLVLPAGSRVDVVAAEENVAAAERALEAGDAQGAVEGASAAAAVARGTFLPGEDAVWIDEQRSELHELLLRSLECLAEASRQSGRPTEAVRAAEELVAREPFRERGYRLLMQAQSAAGNDAEALRTYERCRTLLAEELGAYPSPETETAYRELLGSPGAAPADGSPQPAEPGTPPRRNRRKIVALVAGVLLVAAAAAVALAFATGDEAPAVLPTSLVRLDPDTFEPTQVVRIGPRADLVAVAGGFVWVTHGLLRYNDRGYEGKGGLRDAGDRTLERVDPSTGETKVVGGGIAPCGLAADPSGDVWVANCYASGSNANVVRIDARSLEFEKTRSVPGGAGFYRGMAYGGGSLWVGPATDDSPSLGVTELELAGGQRRVPLGRAAAALAWAEGYGDLWMTNFELGTVSRMHGGAADARTYASVAVQPAPLVVQGGEVWVGDWQRPALARLPAVGSRPVRHVSLPVVPRPSGVTSVAAGAGAIWATVPDDRALWRIDPKTNDTKRIPVKYYPWGVAVGDDGIWVALRAQDA